MLWGVSQQPAIPLIRRLPTTSGAPPPAAIGVFVATLILGAFAQILQAVLIREALVVFYGNEISLGAFYAGWLFWIGVGSVAVLALLRRPDRPRRRRLNRVAAYDDPLPLLRALLLALPLSLAVQVLALRVGRGLLSVAAGELVPLGELFASLLLITAPSGLLLGLIFPLACRALELAAARRGAARIVSRLYVADALGALAGGALFTLLLLRGTGVVPTLGLLTALMGLAVWTLRPRLLRPGLLAPLVTAAGLLLALTPAAQRLEPALERLRFATLQPGMTLLDAAGTRYGHVAVAALGAQRSLVEDGQISASFPLPRETAADAALLAAEADGPRRILLLGGFASGLAAELLRYPVNRVDQIEQDQTAFTLVSPYLDASAKAAIADPRLDLIFADGRRFLRDLRSGQTYDLIVVFAPSPTNAAGNRFFTTGFYDAGAAHLSAHGVLCTRVSSASNYLGREVGSFAGSIYRTLRTRFDRIALVPGDQVTLCASGPTGPVSEDPAELKRRYLALPLSPRTFPADGFRTLLDRSDLAYLHERLDGDTAAEINTDARPISYYLNTLLWGKLSASGLVDWMQRLRAQGPWPYLLPPLALIALWLLRAPLEGWPRARLQRQGAGFALFVLGLCGMAAQLVLLYGVQAQVGYLFERIALLNGLFMTGLALGAGFGQRLAVRRSAVLALAAVLVTVGIVVLVLPWLLHALGLAGRWPQELGYPLLALLIGTAAGSGFPLSVAVADLDLANTTGSAGLTQAADNFGGALGGLVTGALMVPLLGIAETGVVLAALVVIALLPLAFASLVPVPMPRLSARGRASLPRPWPALGWGLWFCVVVAFGWHWLERAAEPGPQVEFDAEHLAGVAGAASDALLFSEVKAPFAHYLGRGAKPGGAGSAEPRLAAAATQAAAPEVRGYGGPLNLLIGIDHEGRLTGVHYLASQETPSYIDDVDTWLTGLAGADLAAGPLSLEHIDGMSGATVTSRAVFEAVNRTAARLSQAAFGSPTPRLDDTVPRSRLDLGFWSAVVLLALWLPAYLAGSDRARLLVLIGALAVLGVWLNTPITEVDLTNLLRGHAAGPTENPLRWLLLGFIALTSVLFGQVWCGSLCPFGALQELLGRLGRRLRLRRYPDRRLDARLRLIKFVLLPALLVAVLASDEGTWAGFDPMQHVFGALKSGGMVSWMLALTLVVLAASVVYVRFWCRYLCPMGALLALANKVALLQRLAPQRRFEHCDLGVRDEFDLDCIRCNRCLSGRDTRLKPTHDALQHRRDDHEPRHTSAAAGERPG